MSVRRHVAISMLVAAGALVAGTAAHAAAPSAPACAQTADPNTPAAPSPGNPCWTDVTPYPFGSDGNPVDSTSPLCEQTPADCYLQVQSMAFRAWNRGLAAVAPPPGARLGTTGFGVWLFNGARWFPDPTYPGQSVCPGNTVLWAGKLDYWLIGGTGRWPVLCRFDGVNFQWEPLAVPAATKADAAERGLAGGVITSGACTAWNDCWFFGTGGAVIHWDGQSLSDARIGLGPSPWLNATYAAAVARTDAAGNPYGVAVTSSTAAVQPDGSPAPQVFGSTGGVFFPVGSADSVLGVSNPTDFVAVDFDPQGDGWLAGDPAGRQPSTIQTTGGAAPAPSPIGRISTAGAPVSCTAAPPSTFMFAGAGTNSYLWSSIGAMPDGSAVAGGQFVASIQSNDEPVLTHISCNQPPTVTRFRVPDPTASNPATAPPIPADEGGYVTGVAANAVNDAWAGVSGGSTPIGVTPRQVPRLYRLTDGQPPDAPAGDDNEQRPLVFQPEPSIFVIAPPVVVPPPPPAQVVSKRGKRKRRTVRLASPVYHVRRPQVVRLPNGTFILKVSFSVRRKVKIGLEGLRGKRVVSSSGVKTFSGKSGTLVLGVDPKNWPTGLKFILPAKQPKAGGHA